MKAWAVSYLDNRAVRLELPIWWTWNSKIDELLTSELLSNILIEGFLSNYPDVVPEMKIQKAPSLSSLESTEIIDMDLVGSSVSDQESRVTDFLGFTIILW